MDNDPRLQFENKAIYFNWLRFCGSSRKKVINMYYNSFMGDTVVSAGGKLLQEVWYEKSRCVFEFVFCCDDGVGK